jgi:uncharacterized protein (TIGR03086 family)
MSHPAATDWSAVVRTAHAALRNTVAAVPEDAWHRPTPCQAWTVTQVLQHAAGDQLAFAAALSTGNGPDFDPFSPSGTLAEPAAALLRRGLDAAETAWAGAPADAEQLPSPIPPGSLPAWQAAGACALDAAVHAWDIAMATGQPSPLTPELGRALYAVATEIVEPLRAYGAYAAALPTEPGDDDVRVLLAYLGRNPDWTAP